MNQFIAGRDLRGHPIATCTCGKCGHQETIKCDFAEKIRVGEAPAVNEAQAITKLTATGWTYIKKKLLCPNCEAQRRKPAPEAKEPDMTTASAPLRQPTRDQKRFIVAALEEAYDVTKQRYRDAETDKTISDMLGNGIMPGWVAAIREDMFGPDGNDELVTLSEEVKDWMSKADRALANANSAISEMVEARGKVKEISLRLSKLIAAIGPKAEKV